MKLAPCPIFHTHIITLRALQLDKTCSFSANCAEHGMANVHKENTILVLGPSKQTGSIWHSDKPVKRECLTADIGSRLLKVL